MESLDYARCPNRNATLTRTPDPSVPLTLTSPDALTYCDDRCLPLLSH